MAMSDDDEVFWDPQRKPLGYQDENRNWVYSDETARAYSDDYWGGYKSDYKENPNAINDGTPYKRVGPGGQEADVNRYRGLGEMAAARAAYRPDFALADQDTAQWNRSRLEQASAAGYLQQGATGAAPSRAEILGSQLGDQSLNASLSATANTRGGSLAQSAALANASQSAQNMQLQGIGNYAGMRGQEMVNARGAYMGALGGMRSQAYAQQELQQQQAEAFARAENFQRELNQQGQLAYEQRGFDVNRAALQAGLTRESLRAQRDGADKAADEAKTNEMWSKIGGGASAVGSIFASDERTKQDVLPLYEPEGQQLHVDGSGRAFLASEAAKAKSGPSLSGPAPRYSKASLSETAAKAKPTAKPERKMTEQEMAALADKMIAETKAKEKRELARGPAVRRLSEGSRESGYETELTSGAEKAYQERYGKERGPDYDLRGAYAEGLLDRNPGDRNSRGEFIFNSHLPDTYKKPNHETFSNESQYAKDEPNLAGHWDGDRFVENSKAPPRWLREYSDRDNMGAALEHMQPYAYQYRPGFREAEGQAPGESNVGPMAQEMASNPLTATAVKRGPDGLLYIDQPKALKLSLGGVGYLAAKQREQEERLAQLEGGGQ